MKWPIKFNVWDGEQMDDAAECRQWRKGGREKIDWFEYDTPMKIKTK